ncbi:MAG: putative periplasmic protein [Rhodobacteraceae bacterium HLUCCA08]|nr:MAG: putative periplasmic protein [Rhodobacteraceae bacterium HLUCCA08]
MRAALLALILAPGATSALECRDLEHLGQSFTICEVDLARERIETFLRDDYGRILGSFEAVERAAGGPVLMAMNAGMYHADRSPVGLYVEDGATEQRLIESAGPGNFGLLPNGVFCVAADGVRIVETRAFAASERRCDFASQSGPMLVLDGALHPRLIPGGSSRHIRNGVGAGDGRVVFAISNQPVNFHDFATLFRDALGLDDALYFDGKVSRLHVPALGRSDIGLQMGPIVAVRPIDGTAAGD